LDQANPCAFSSQIAGPWRDSVPTRERLLFDVFQRLRLVPTERHTEAKALLERIASMLIKLAKSLQAPPE
jgi:hypothetical protein